MSVRILSLLSLAAAAVSGLGCALPNWQAKAEQLQRENEDLERQKAQLEADNLAYKARLEGQERRRPAPAAAEPRPAAPAPYEMPAELEGKVEIRRRGSDTVIEVPSDVFFASGSSLLNRDGEKTMGSIAAFIQKRHPGGLLRVEGHSDADPIRRTKSKYHCNWELSFERSHAVVHWLVEKGNVDPRRVVCEAHGEFHPVDPANKSKNRRVEIVIAP